MKKIRRKTKKVKEEKAAEPSVKVDIIMLNDKINEMKDMINDNKQKIDNLLTEQKKFIPVVTASPVAPEIPLVSRYDDVCKEIDKELK